MTSIAHGDTAVRFNSARDLLIALLVTVTAVLGLIGLANYLLNPIIYSPSYMRTIAAQLRDGFNYKVYDPNVNWRALRREELRNMKATPQVVVWGGSRWQEATADLIPSKAFYNAHAHSDYSEDFLAITQLLEETGHMPETLVLSLRYAIFEPIESRKPSDWREFMPEYRAMAVKLGIEPHPWYKTLRTQHWLGLLSVGDLWTKVNRQFSGGDKPGPTKEATTDTMDVIGADGSLRWSRKSGAMFTPEFARKDALKQLANFAESKLRIDAGQVQAAEKLLAYLKKQGVNVILAQTPFHPAFYDGMRDRQFGKTLDRIEAMGTEFGKKYGIAVVGTFDPHKLGCPETQFIDWHHATGECLKLVFDQMPITRVSNN